MKRREAIAVLSSSALTLIGCSGGNPVTGPNPPSPPTGLPKLTGTLSLPTGSTIDPTSLSLRVMGQLATPTAAGSFSLSVSAIAPTLAIATDATGNGILAGMLDPATGATAITPRSTGVALVWFALGGPFLPSTIKSQALAMLAVDPRMDALGAVIAQRVAVNPHAVVDGDAQIAAALTGVLDALVPPALLAPQPSSAAQLSVAADAPQIILTPNIDQGGVSVRLDNAITGIDLANAFRRPVRVYVYEVQKSTAGVVTDLVPAKLVAGPLSMDEPLAFAAPSTLSALLSAAAPYDPFTLGPVALALDGTSDETTFEVVVIGPSSNGVIPAFFGAGRYATHVAGWNAAISTMFDRTYYVDLVYAFLLEVAGFASTLATSPKLADVAAATKSAMGTPFPATGGNASLPPTTVGLRATLRAIDAQAHAIDQQLDAFRTNATPGMDAAGAGALQQVTKTDWAALLATGSNFTSKLASPFTGAKSSGAISRLFSNLSDADRGVLWTVKLSKAKVTINPPSPVVDAGEMVALTITLSPDLTSTYEYRWTQNGTGSELSASDTPQAASITTTQKSVTLFTMPQQTGSISVQVAVYDIGTPGRKVLVTQASTSVRILQRSTISPNPKALFRGNQQLFTVTVEGTLPAGAKYVWNVTGTAGTIGSVGAVTTTVPSINYTAVNKGDDVLHLQITDAAGLLLSRATAVINVDPTAFFECTISGSWDRTKTPANGHYFYGDTGAQRSLAPESGFDWLTFISNLAADDTIGAFVGIFVPPSHVFVAGQTFVRIQSPAAPTARSWNMFLSLDQNDVENSDQRTPEGTGVLTLTSVNHRSDGKWEGLFSFTLTNGTGTITGSTAGVW